MPTTYKPKRGRPSQKVLTAAKALQSAFRKKKSSVPSVAQVSNQVKSLKLTQKGSIQYARQYLRWRVAPQPPAASPFFFDPKCPSSLRPIMFLHQAISEGTPIHTLEYAAGPTLNLTTAGAWVNSPYPPVANYGLPGVTNGLYDQLQYWSQAAGASTSEVSNDYLHMQTKYQLQISANNCRGYMDIFIVHPTRSFVRSTQQDVSLPTGIQGFTNLSLGCNNQYNINKQYYSMKKLKRHYFNTTNPAGTQPAAGNYLNTNPDICMEFTVRNKKTRRAIKAPELFQGGILDATDIPYTKQDWILISTTLENSQVTPDNCLKINNIWRSVTWRDREGAST